MEATSNFPIVSFAFLQAFVCGLEKHLDLFHEGMCE